MVESTDEGFKFKGLKANENTGGRNTKHYKGHLLHLCYSYPQAGTGAGAFVSSGVKTNQKENRPELARRGGEKYLILSNQKHLVQPEHCCVS